MTFTADGSGWMEFEGVVGAAPLQATVHPLPHYRVGGKIIVRRSEFDDWVQQFRGSVTSTLDVIVDDVMRSLV